MVTWTGPSGGDWNNANNWSPTGVPNYQDDVQIDSSTPLTVNIDSGNQSVESLELAATGTLAVSGGSLTVANGAMIDGTLQLSGSPTLTGSFTGGAASSATYSGNVLTTGQQGATFDFPNLVWSSGTISGTITNAGTLTVSSTAPKYADGVLNNAGTIVQTGVDLEIGSGANPGMINNLPAGQFDVQTDDVIGVGYAIWQYSSGGAINNSGTFRKSAGAGTASVNVTFSNSAGATVDARVGTLDLIGGGSLSGGAFDAQTGAGLDLGSSDYATTAIGTFTGSGGGVVAVAAGTLTIGSSGATFDFPSSLFEVDGGTIDDSAGSLINQGAIDLVAGTLGAGSGVVTNDGALTVSSSQSKRVVGVLNNGGTITQTGIDLEIASGTNPGTINNLPGGLFDVQTDDVIGVSYAIWQYSSGGAINNSGTFQKSAGAGTASVNVTFSNSAGATVDAKVGTLELIGGGTLSGGAFDAESGSTLDFDSIDYTTTVNGTLTGSGGGAVEWTAGTLISGAGGAAFDFPAALFQWKGGSLNGSFTNTGTIQVGGGVLIGYNAPGILKNTGRIVVGAKGVLSMGAGQGVVGTLDNQVGGSVDLEFTGYISRGGNGGGAILDNEGTLVKSDGGTSSFSSFAGGGLYFNNDGGAVNVESGTLTIGAYVTQISGNTLTGGTWNVFAGSTLSITNAGSLTTNAADVTLSGAGSTFASIDGITTSSGTLNILDGASFTTTGDLSNQGTITVGAGSVVTVKGAYTQSADAALGVEVGGPSSSGQFGELNASGNATLDGALNVNLTGLDIRQGDSFPIMSFGSGQGAFATVSGLYAGRTQVLQVAQNTTDVTIDAIVNTATLAVASVTFVPAMDVPGQGVTVTYNVNNLEDIPTSIDSWYDSIYLSAGTTVTPSSKLIGRVLHNGVVQGLGSYTGTLTAPLPGEIPGAYHILVICDSRGLVPDFNRTQDVGVASDTIGVDIPTLTPNTPMTGTIESGQEEYFQVNLPAGSTVRVTAGFSVASGAALFVRYQDVPDPATYDEYAFNPNLKTQQIVLANNQAGTYYIVLQGQPNAVGGQPLTLTAQELSLAVLGATPNTGGNGGDTTVTIQGSELTPATAVSLVGSDGTKHPAAAVFYKDSSTLFATFDLTGLPVGPYDVRVDDHGSTDTDAGAFTVTTGGGGDVVYNMSAPNFVRDGSMGTVTVTYDNIGASDAPAPLLAVIGTNAVLRLPDQPDFAGSTVQFLAISNTGPAGILPPGEIGHITMYFQASTTAPPGSQISFERGLGATDQPIDWASDKDNLQPPSVSSDAWDAIWTNFLAQVGTTAGDLQAALDKDADYLSQFGEYDYDVTPLISFELQKADDFGAISQRYALGAFGRGWPDPTDIKLTTDSFGDVTIEYSGQVRTFTLESNGTYQGAPGDSATLAKETDGSYQLRETDGTITAFNPDGTLNYTEDTNKNKITANYTGGLLTSFVDSTGDTVAFTYDSQDRITQVTDPVGRVTTYSYDSTDQLLMSVTDETGTTNYTYVKGQGTPSQYAIASITYADGSQTLFNYNALGQLTSQEADQAGDEEITYAYDSEGSVKVTDAAGGTSTYFLNEFQQVAAYEDALGHFTEYTYDANHNLVQEAGPDGLTTTFANNAAGDTTSSTDPGGNKISATYDSLLNNLTSLTDANGNVTQYSYDANGNLLDITYPDSSQQQFTYDPTGDLTESVDQNGNATNYIYYSDNLLKEEDLADGSKITFAYDSHRNLISATNSVGTTSFQYDSADRLTEVTYPNGMFLKFTYNAGGQRTQMVDQTGFTVKYQYDAVGRLSELTDGSGNLIVQYTYDLAGRLIQKNLGNGTYTTYGYDLAGDLTGIINYKPGGTVLSSYDYTYNASGLPVSVTTLQGTTTYGYDATGQLTSVGLPGGTAITYQYDAAGNRVSVDDNGVTTIYKTNNMNEYTKVGSTTYAYDKDGNLISSTDSSGTTTYTYNDLNQLVGIESPQGTWTYQYDALGDLIAETQNGQETQYLIDPTGIGNVVGTFDASGNLIDHYTQGLGLTSQVDASGAAAYYDFDLTGNTTELTGEDGAVLNTYSYLPFGEQLTVTGATPNPFTYGAMFGILENANGLYAMRARDYDPTLGAFLSNDPIGLAGGSSNLREFAHDSPTSNVDPVGLNSTFVGVSGGGYYFLGGTLGVTVNDNGETFLTVGAGLTTPGVTFVSLSDDASGGFQFAGSVAYSPPPLRGWSGGLSVSNAQGNWDVSKNVSYGTGPKGTFFSVVGASAMAQYNIPVRPTKFLTNFLRPFADESVGIPDESPLSPEALRLRRLRLQGKLFHLPVKFEDL
jgi:RHS repeat-associated protein